MLSFFLTFIVALVLLFLEKRGRHFDGVFTKFSQNQLLKFLLIFIGIGFIANLDHSDSYGCIVEFAPFWEARKVFYSSISALLITAAFFTKNVSVRRFLVLIETAYWIFKLIVIKEGYEVGFGGSPIELVVLYDFMAFAIRVLLIGKIWKQFSLSLVKLMSLCLFVIAIRIFVSPIFFYYIDAQRWAIEQERIEEELLGEWIGTCKSYQIIETDTSSRSQKHPLYSPLPKRDTFHYDTTILLTIIPDYFYFDGLSSLDTFEYYLHGEFGDLIRKNYSYLQNNNIENQYSIRIKDFNEDKLVFSLEGRSINEKYVFTMKRK